MQNLLKKQRKPKIMAWLPDRVELLLKYLKEYKATADFNGKDFEQATQLKSCG